MKPYTGDWDDFRITRIDHLRSHHDQAGFLATTQPVPMTPSGHWHSDLLAAIVDVVVAPLT